MDKLAQRAGVAALVLIASAGTALAYGMYRMALSLEPATREGDRPAPAVALLKLPDEFGVTPVPPTPVAAPVAPATPAAAPALARPPAAPATDLASAVGAALGAKPRMKTATLLAPQPAPTRVVADEASASDELDLGFKSPARETRFNERGARAFAVHQTGGAEQQRKAEKAPGERISFETDLGSPASP
jgi:hypothetical protein